jgi:Ca2+-binding EF-hand superfamily protein
VKSDPVFVVCGCVCVGKWHQHKLEWTCTIADCSGAGPRSDNIGGGLLAVKMGACLSIPIEPHIDYEFEALGLKQRDLTAFQQHFDKMVSKSEPKVPVAIILSVLELEDSATGRSLFSMYDGLHNAHKTKDLSTNGLLDFKQFVLLVWNFCTLTIRACACQIFELYDKDCKGSLTTDDVITVLSDLKVPKEKITR